MAIRLPLKAVLSYEQTVENGAGVAVGNASTAGGVAKPFQLPQDTDNVVLKFQASIKGAGASVIFQTSDDGGTTYYDGARTSVVSNSNNTTAQWLNIPVNGHGFRSAVQGQNSVEGATNTTVALNTTGTAAASALGQSQQTGLPILGVQNRAFVVYAAGITSIISEKITVSANSQSATA